MPNNSKKSRSIGSIIKFVSFATIVFVGANMLVYRAFISAFQLQDSSDAFLIGTLFVIFSGGFIATLIIEKYSAGIATRILYTVTAVWTGTFVYLFFAAILYDISKRLFYDPRVFGVFFFFIAFAAGIYGVVHAKKIFIKKVRVALPNLPESWRGRTAVWMSDLHLGSIYRTRFAKKVTRISNSLSPDIVFVGGDLFDGTHAPDPYKLAKPLANLSSQFGTFYITGNHEEFGSPDSFLEVVQKIGMTILNDEKIEIEGLQIVGVDYSRSSKKENFKNLSMHIYIKSIKTNHGLAVTRLHNIRVVS